MKQQGCPVIAGWIGWGLVLMMIDIKEKIIKNTLYLMLVVALIMCFYFITVSSCLSQRILAGSLVVTIIVGGFVNMFNIFRTSKKFDGFIKLKADEIANMNKQIAQKDTEIEVLKEANRLNERQIELLTKHKY